MRGAWLTGVAVAALAAGPARGDEWSHRYPLSGRADLQVKTDDGSVRVETHDAREIAARVTTEGWRIAPDEVTITESQVGDRVQIEVRLPRNRTEGSGKRRSLEVLVTVPKQADIDVRTGDGSVHVQPVSGRLSVSTGDGAIRVEGSQGEIRLHTGDGSIQASGLDGRLKADTGDGRLSVEGRFEALELRTGDGGIEADVAPGSKLATAWSLSSGDGGITLRIPDGFGAELDAQSGDGGVTLDKPITVSGTITRSSVRGTLGPGGLPLKIYTGDGSIKLLRP